MTSTRGGYLLDNTWDKARHRVGLIEQMHDAGTTDGLRAAGIAPGWRCLEVGAGAGSIARWMCDAVGPAGSVTAVDIEPTLLRDQPRPNLEIVQADVTADPLPGEGYDLVHARALLMHVPDREDLIASMIQRLRPGGAILLEEADFYPVATSECAAFVEVFRAAVTVAAGRGGDWCWARHLPARLAAAGAIEVTATTGVAMFRGGQVQAEFMRISLEQVAPLLEAAGIDPGVITEAGKSLDDPDRWFPGYAYVSAAGRRPD